MILCEAGCGWSAGESGFCWTCERGFVAPTIEAAGPGATRLRALWDFEAHRCAHPAMFETHEKPYMPDWMYWFYRGGAIAFILWFGYRDRRKCSPTGWRDGGSPWQ